MEEEGSGGRRKARIQVSNDAAARLAQIMLQAVDKRKQHAARENGVERESDEHSDDSSQPHRGVELRRNEPARARSRNKGVQDDDEEATPSRMPNLPPAIQHRPRDSSEEEWEDDEHGNGNQLHHTSRFRRKAAGRSREDVHEHSIDVEMESSSAPEELSSDEDDEDEDDDRPRRHKRSVTKAELRLRSVHGPVYVLYVQQLVLPPVFLETFPCTP